MSSEPVQRAVLAFACAALLVACGAETTDKDTLAEYAGEMSAVEDPGPSDRFDTAANIIRVFDLNKDDVADLWKIFIDEKIKIDDLESTLRLVRKEVDSNFDKHVDIWFHYNKQELLFKEEADTNFDGAIDLIEYYEAGRIVKRELFKGSVATPAATKHYREGRLVKIEIDTNADGVIDKWEIYSGGRLVQVGYDTDGDNRVDRWDDFNE